MADDSPESPPAPDGEAPSHVDLERLEGRHIGSGAARKHGLTVAVLEEWQYRFGRKVSFWKEGSGGSLLLAL